VGDASQLEDLAPLAGVLSVFGLQQVRCGSICKLHALLAATRQHAHTSRCPAALTTGCPAEQMPEPAAALANWTRALGPGGVLAVCFWPPTVEQEGPWKRLFELTVGFKPQADWEAEIPEVALREGAKLLQVLRLPGELAYVALHGGVNTLVIVSSRFSSLVLVWKDCRPVHEMCWPSVEEFWEGITQAGPWHR
jgi:hypothetical protein